MPMWVMPISIASPLRTVVPSELKQLLLEFLDPFREGWKNLARYFPQIGIVAGWWWLEHDEYMTFHSVGNGMSSSQVTFIIFLRGVGLNHQPGWYIMIYPMISRISIRNIHPKKGNSWNLDSPGFYWDSSSWLGIVRRRMTARIPW